MAVKNNSGFTIVELLVSILMTSIIMAAIYSVYRVQTHSSKVQESRLEAQEYARSVLDIMVREIRNAAYNPLGAVSGTALGTGCASGVGGSLVGVPGIVSADVQTITFTYDFTGATPSVPDGNCTSADEQITYTYNTAGCPSPYGNVTRNGSSNPLTNCNVTSFSLSYFKQDGTSITTPVSAADLLNIQRVQISITVQSLKPDTEFSGQLNATMTSNADLRNRGLPS